MKKIIAICILSLSIITIQAQDNAPSFALVIHGGAGTITRENMTPELEEQYHAKMKEALAAGYKILEQGGSSTDAVVATIKIMEDSPLFNAGKGAVFTNEGRNELDASIMEGKTGLAGAVAGITNVKNPITAAVAVMNQSEHVMMSGPGAEKFAKASGLEIVDPSYFHTDRRYKQLQKRLEREKQNGQGSINSSVYKFGTVGAVALDKEGNITAGTSTGGMTNKRYGRIGDSPIIGAGTYANNQTCGISATGHGEFFIRNVVAYDVSALMQYKNLSITKAADEVIMNKLKKIGGEGGIVGLDKSGNIMMSFNTPGMYRGYVKANEEPLTFIYKD